MLHVHALDRADAGREDESLRLAERLGSEPATPFLPDDRRIQAFLDSRPDGEARAEVVAIDHEVGTVPDAELVDGTEEVVHRVAGEHVRQSRLDPHAREGQQPALLPLRGELELLVSELHPCLGVGLFGMWAGERHGHVHVVDARYESCAVDRHDKTGVDRVEDHIAVLRPNQLGDHQVVGGIDLEARETVRDRRCFLRTLFVVVGHHDLLEVAPARRYMGKGAPDSTGSYDENSHEKVLSRQSD